MNLNSIYLNQLGKLLLIITTSVAGIIFLSKPNKRGNNKTKIKVDMDMGFEEEKWSED